MINEFKHQLELYSEYLDRYRIPGKEKPNLFEATEYLNKYGISNASYQNEWRLLHGSIFDLNKRLPDMIFKKDFEYISLLGSVIFEEIDFEFLKSCIQRIGDKYLLVIQDNYGMPPPLKDNTLKMKFLSSINWAELISGNFISVALFEASENDYYVFGDSGEWGMYVASTYVNEAVNMAGTPIRIIGFDPKHRSTFRAAFEIPEGEYCENIDYIAAEERPDLKDWVPKSYRMQQKNS